MNFSIYNLNATFFVCLVFFLQAYKKTCHEKLVQ